MLRSRVTTGFDMARMANALSRPGIDPRIWISYGVLTSEPYIEMRNGQQDVLVDVTLLPSGDQETARVGAAYAGNGFGLYMPLHEDDEVLVLAPSGDPDQGLVIAQRLWSPADPPPQEVATHPEDVTLVVEAEKNLRLNVKGAGNVVISAEEGKVKLGSESATKGVARVDDTTTNGALSVTAVGPVVTLTYTPASGTPQAITLTFPDPVLAVGGPLNLSGKINAGSTKVVAS